MPARACDPSIYIAAPRAVDSGDDPPGQGLRSRLLRPLVSPLPPRAVPPRHAAAARPAGDLGGRVPARAPDPHGARRRLRGGTLASAAPAGTAARPLPGRRF